MTGKQLVIQKLCDAIWQMNKQAHHDFGGEQREFYIPRLQESMIACATLFTAQMARSMDIKEDEKDEEIP